MEHTDKEAPYFSASVLSDRLKNNGHLESGCVVDLWVREMKETPPSKLYFLEAVYSEKLSPKLPTNWFLKIPKPHKRHTFGRKEVLFYSQCIEFSREFPLLKCYDAHYSEEDDVCHLLFADMSATHSNAPTIIYKDLSHLLPAVCALARLHANFWDSPFLSNEMVSTAKQLYLDDFSENPRRYHGLIERLGREIPERWREIFERFLRSGAELLRRRVRETKSLTFCHGDTHRANILFPKDEKNGQIHLIDFQNFRSWFGPKDISQLLIMASKFADRRENERHILKCYYQTLVANGVLNYSWDLCWNDYRLGTLEMLDKILGNRDLPGAWLLLENVMSSYDSLQCDNLYND